MFYILLFISLMLIFTGIYIDRQEIIDKIFEKMSKVRNKDELDMMQEKIRELERKLEETSKIEQAPESVNQSVMETEGFIESVNEEVQEETIEDFSDEVVEDKQTHIKEDDFENIYEETQIEREEVSLHDKLKLMSEYEKQGKNINEISELMNMKKGEILLLKKLYRKS